MTDGTVREFKHLGRPGGSYTVRLTFEGEFAIVTDEWGDRNGYSGPPHLRDQRDRRAALVKTIIYQQVFLRDAAQARLFGVSHALIRRLNPDATPWSSTTAAR